MQQELFRRLNDKREDVVALTQDLVRIPTINPPGAVYRDCAELIGNRLANKGFSVQYIRGEGSPGDDPRYPRVNVLARLEGSGAGPVVHFNGHIDVVDVGSGWTKDPFGGEVSDGKVYGRGTCDMKGGLAAAIVAVETIQESGIRFPGAIEISGTVDEETGGFGGVGYMARQGWFSPERVQHVVIPEPLNVDRVCIGHRGVWWAKIQTFGHIGHGSMPHLGDCAIRHMTAFLSALEKDIYPKTDARQSVMPIVPDGAKASTLNICTIHGGLDDHFNGLPSPLVPDHCHTIIERRFAIEETLGDVKSEIMNILEKLTQERPRFKYKVEDIMEFVPTLTDENAPVVRAFADEIHRLYHRQARLVVSPGTYDQKHLHRIANMKNCIAYGPGILDLAHQPDEYIGIDDMCDSMKIIAAATLNLLGACD